MGSEQDLLQDTIAAIATPAGTGGIGIVRVSGPKSAEIARSLIGGVPGPGRWMRARFSDASGVPLDDGVALFFQNPV